MPDNAKRAAARRRIAEKRAAEAAARARSQRRRRAVVGGIVAAVLLVVAVVVTVVVQDRRTATAADATVPANTADGGDVVVGQATAPVTIDLYEDFQCPNCKNFEDTDGATLASLVSAGTVQLHYHGMAFLDTSANDQYSTRALNAAAAVVNAAGPDAFQTFHDLLYANQPAEGGSGLTDDQLVAYATRAGAGGDAVGQQIRALAYGDWVKTVTDQASKDGVTATPTVRVAGQQLEDLSVAGLTAAVQAARAQ